jgi:hypothetical protein
MRTKYTGQREEGITRIIREFVYSSGKISESEAEFLAEKIEDFLLQQSGHRTSEDRLRSLEANVERHEKNIGALEQLLFEQSKYVIDTLRKNRGGMKYESIC